MTAPAGHSMPVHGTAVAQGDAAVLITGPSGSGKSDLALRLIDRGWRLISDDYTVLRVDGDVLIAATAANIGGRLEVRGIGIVAVPSVDTVPLRLIADIDLTPERLPPHRLSRSLLGISIPLIGVHAFEASAPVKIAWALQIALGAMSLEHDQ